MDHDDRERLAAWEDILDDSTYYEILGVLEIADDDAIRKAFHQFCLAFHPDAHPGVTPEDEARVRRLFQRGAEACRVLLNPELRAQYDLAVAKGQTRLGVEARKAATGVKSLDDLCRSASGKMHARTADKLISSGDLDGAKRALLMAIRCEIDPDPALDERLDALELLLFAKGS